MAVSSCCRAARRTAGLTRGVIVLTALAVLLFGAARPDAVIARGNVERFERSGDLHDLDVSYLAGLSTDATPALLRLPPTLRDCVVGPQADRLADPLSTAGWGWNLARMQASALLGDAARACAGVPAPGVG